MRMTRLGGILLCVGFCAIIGALSGSPKERNAPVPTRTPPQSPTYTVAKTCDRQTWTGNTLEVINMFNDAVSLALIDALIVKYDSVGTPDCDDDMAQEIDAEVRVAMAHKRTAYMLSGEKANHNMAMADIEITRAANLMARYASQP